MSREIREEGRGNFDKLNFFSYNHKKRGRGSNV